MTLLLLAYLGGVLTILSPCILPVLPFVLARAGQPFAKSGLPMLLGMALAFSAVASLAAVAGGWAVQANAAARWVALGLFALFAASLLWPRLSEWAARPLVALGARTLASTPTELAGNSLATSLLLGAATGLLWAPCAGPVLGLVLTGAALGGASLGSSALLLAYALGAATSLALAMRLGKRLRGYLQPLLGGTEWARRALGGAMLVGVALIASGADKGLLARWSQDGSAQLEQQLVDLAKPALLMASSPAQAGQPTPDTLEGAVAWINSPPLKPEDLRGKVVLVDFWTYSCINCLRTLPYLRAWAERYKSVGLVVVGVHAPEFAFEKDLDNVRRAVRELKITFPVAVDNNFAIWRTYQNRGWPGLYFVDAQGRVRHQLLGEGRYAESERMLQKLLAEAGQPVEQQASTPAEAPGVQAAPGIEVFSGETYLGHERAANFAPSGGALQANRRHVYPGTTMLKLNQWTLAGDWLVEPERASALAAGTRLTYRFRARDLHLVLSRDAGLPPVRFRVRVDGQPPGSSHGSDVDAQGWGVLDAHKLYQLVRLPASNGEHVFEIEFLDAGAQAYAFTFG